MTVTTPVSTANKISINTPDGPIMAEAVCDGSQYPGIQVLIGDQMVAWVEYNSTNSRLEMHIYPDRDNDEPITYDISRYTYSEVNT